MAMQLDGKTMDSLDVDELVARLEEQGEPMDDSLVLAILRTYGAGDPRLDHVPAEQWQRCLDKIEWIETLNNLPIYAMSAGQSYLARLPDPYEEYSPRGITYREYLARKAARPIPPPLVEDEPHFICTRSILDLSLNGGDRHVVEKTRRTR